MLNTIIEREISHWIISNQNSFEIREERDYRVNTSDVYNATIILKNHDYIISPHEALPVKFDRPEIIDLYDDGTEIKIPNTGKYYPVRLLILKIVNYLPVSCKFILNEKMFWNAQIEHEITTEDAEKMMLSGVFDGVRVVNLTTYQFLITGQTR